MQSFKASAHSSADTSPIQFAPYRASNLTRAYVIYGEASELNKTERNFSTLPGFCLIGWHTDRVVALNDIVQMRPELTIVYSPSISSVDYLFAKTLKEEVPTTNIIFISSEPIPEQLRNLLRSGASGFCLNSTNPQTLNLAFQTVSLGAVWIDPIVATNIFSPNKAGSSEETSQPALSDREKEVLHLVAEGLTNQEIALKLWLSRETVKSHVKKIMRKLSVKDRTQAAVAALRLGLAV
ncbi:MAG: response regulator transcription factor [Candidatus Obscuribacterales bacterium]|nr:response regulator transcription factor [Candidatus Obscuribacterales bacterium]